MTRSRHAARRRRDGVATKVVSALLALGTLAAAALGIWWWRSSDDLVPGTYVAPSKITSSSSSSTSRASSSTSPTKKPSATTRSSTTSSSSTSSPTSKTTQAAIPAPPGDPTRVVVTTAGGKELVDASLIPTYLDAQNVLAPPFGTAGWYAEEGWPKPGHAGASILVGHINHGSQPDVFWNLPQVSLGDRVTVTYGSGRTVEWTITRSEAATKQQVPKDDSIWDHDNPAPLLRLITCDPTTPLRGGHFEGNWVVWAELA